MHRQRVRDYGSYPNIASASSFVADSVALYKLALALRRGDDGGVRAVWRGEQVKRSITAAVTRCYRSTGLGVGVAKRSTRCWLTPGCSTSHSGSGQVVHTPSVTKQYYSVLAVMVYSWESKQWSGRK